MEFLLVMLLLAPFATLFSGGGGGDGAPDGGDGDGGESDGGNGDVTRLTDGNDIVVNSNGQDHAVLAGNGNDDIRGADSWDILDGQSGNDVLSGGAASDVLIGGVGDDRLYGNAGDDDIIGGAGNDLMQGGVGNDYFLGSGGADTLRGGVGNDLLDAVDLGSYAVPTPQDMLPVGYTDANGDEVLGLEDHVINRIDDTVGQTITDRQTQDILADLRSVGAPLADVVDAGEGDDALMGDAGDTLIGGAGDDRFTVYGGQGGPAYISDFDASNETLRIYVPYQSVGPVEVTASEAGAQITWADETIVVLQGLTPADIDPDRIEVWWFSD